MKRVWRGMITEQGIDGVQQVKRVSVGTATEQGIGGINMSPESEAD